MMQQTSLGVAIVLALAQAGCGYFRQAPAPAAAPPMQELSVHGVTYELPLAAHADNLAAARSHLKSLTSNGIKWTNGTYTLEVNDEVMTLNGEKYGAIHKRDRVQLTAEGVLTVNGQQRRRTAD